MHFKSLHFHSFIHAPVSHEMPSDLTESRCATYTEDKYKSRQ